jgi:hypothetical protein
MAVLVAVIVAPIAAVIVVALTQYLQAKRRNRYRDVERKRNGG